MEYLSNLFVNGSDPKLLLFGIYNPWLVALSIFIAIFASGMALQVAGMARLSQTLLHRQVAIITGSMALGGGIWSMHFIGMLAFDLCTKVEYDPALTLLSMLPSLGASWVALQLLSRGEVTLLQLIESGVLVGAGIGAMHYSGMAAMRMAPLLRYDPWWFGLSIVVAVILAILALWIRFGLRGFKYRLPVGSTIVISGIVMGVAIAGMHYTGMAAARFIATPDTQLVQATSGSTFVALAVSLITIALTIFVAATNGLIRYRQLFRQMQSNESRLQAIVDTAVDGIITYDEQGIIQAFNRSAELMFGWQAAELIGKRANLLMAPPYDAEYDQYLRDYLRTGQQKILGQAREVVGLRKDGSLMPARLAIGQANLPGQYLFVSFITDISERKAMEQALRDSERQYRSLIRNIPGASFRCLLDDDRTILFISDAIQTLSGWEAKDFLEKRKSFAALVHPDDHAGWLQEIQRATQEEQNYVVEYRIVCRDGRELWVWESGGAVRNEQGQPQWIDGVILDISERRKMEEAVRAERDRAELAAASKTTFLANMSHEIRTPMNAIIGFTELLLDTPLDNTQRRHMDTVRQAARSLLGLLNDILDTAKLEKGAVELESVDFSLHTLAEQICASLRLSAEAKDLSLVLDYHPELDEFFKGDPLRIQQILINLIGNAIKFTERGSVKLEISASSTPGQIHLAVHDTGIGIARDRLDKIFAPFAQADASMSRRFGGTGLGTTIARQLVELMGGQIRVDSRQGVGSVFHVLLPLQKGDAVLPYQEALLNQLPPLNILVADDVPQNLELLSLTFGKAGHNVVTAHNGAEAIRAYVEGKFDVVLMDVQMPHVDGLEATRQIRIHETVNLLPETPVIALTASVLDHDRQAAKAAGMNGFASKPLEMHKLIAEIARLTGVVVNHGTAEILASAHLGLQQIDWPRGVRLWGNRQALSQAIRRFLDQHSEACRQLEQFLDEDNNNAALQLTHKINGAAGNLCLHHMHQLAGKLESALQEKDKYTALALLPLFVIAFADVANELGELTASAATGQAPAPSTPLDQDALRALARSAIASLGRGELDETTLLELNSVLRANGQAARVTALDSAIREFEFGRAAAILGTLLETLENASGSKET
ncbi:MAG: MHYT domain-containing protein [Pseudomonadota bacterium]